MLYQYQIWSLSEDPQPCRSRYSVGLRAMISPMSYAFGPLCLVVRPKRHLLFDWCRWRFNIVQSYRFRHWSCYSRLNTNSLTSPKIHIVGLLSFLVPYQYFSIHVLQIASWTWIIGLLQWLYNYNLFIFHSNPETYTKRMRLQNVIWEAYVNE